MGKIFIEGLGVFNIKGDVPNDEEQRALLDALGQAPETQPEPQPQQPDLPEPAREGPLGIVPPEVRQVVRQSIEDAPGLFGFLAEMTPTTVGMLAGAGIGAPAGPLGMLVGGTAGAVIGEVAGQEVGIAPRSKLNVGLAAAGPVAGRVAGAAARLVGRGTGALIARLPPTRVAAARVQGAKATEKLQSLGTAIIAKTQGVMARPAKVLFRAVRGSGARIGGNSFKTTRDAMDRLVEQLGPVSGFPEVRQAISGIRGLKKALDADDISFDTIATVRQAVGMAVRKAQAASGVKLGTAKQLFRAFNADIDKLAAGAVAESGTKAAKLLKVAVRRAKLEFAVRDLEGMVAKFTKINADGGAVIDARGLLKLVMDITNPKSARFDKNFVAALGEEMIVFKSNLAKLAKAIRRESPGGPGSLILRGRLVGATIGGLAGLGIEGPTGAILGAFGGASLPEMLTGVLMTRRGAAFLEGAIKLGRGEVSARAWMVAGQIAARLAGETREGQPIAQEAR